MTETPSHPSDLQGRLISNRYRLDRRLASGGMAQVWEATDEVLARRVALKILHPHLAADAQFVARFRQEAIAVARLAHPSIMSIFDTCSDGGLEAIVMELVEGPTLRQLLDERRRLPADQAIAVMVEVADALDVAHRAGIVHRDVKPANILLSSDGRVLVADFGIAKAGDDLTATGMTLGTAKYLSPEQVEGEVVDGRADVYSLGVVLYECLTGQVPFTGDNEAAIALARLRSDPTPVRQLQPSVPPMVEAVVTKAMQREPDDRYPTAAALRDALTPAVRAPRSAPVPAVPGRDRTEATVVGLDPTPTPTPSPTPTPRPALRANAPSGPVPATGTAPSTPAARRPIGRSRTPLLAIVGAAVVVVAMVVALVLLGNGAGDAKRKPAPTVDPRRTEIPIRSAQSFDPEPGDGRERNDLAPLAFDGDPDTAWTTENYDNRKFGNLKDGVGLVLSLERLATLEELTLESASRGWSLEVYVSDQTHQTLSGWGRPAGVATNITSQRTTVALEDARGGFVLLWITDLGEGPPRVSTQIAEVAVHGA